MFLCFEGIDGSGTTTSTSLEKALLEKAIPCSDCRTNKRKYWKYICTLLSGSERISLRALQLLFCADREEHLQTEILPALATGKMVLCDRYALSTICYSALSGDAEYFSNISQIFPETRSYHFLRYHPKDALERIAKRSEQRDIFEDQKNFKSCLKNRWNASSRIKISFRCSGISGRKLSEDFGTSHISRYSLVKLSNPKHCHAVASQVKRKSKRGSGEMRTFFFVILNLSKADRLDSGSFEIPYRVRNDKKERKNCHAGAWTRYPQQNERNKKITHQASQPKRRSVWQIWSTSLKPRMTWICLYSASHRGWSECPTDCFFQENPQTFSAFSIPKKKIFDPSRQNRRSSDQDEKNGKLRHFVVQWFLKNIAINCAISRLSTSFSPVMKIFPNKRNALLFFA